MTAEFTASSSTSQPEKYSGLEALQALRDPNYYALPDDQKLSFSLPEKDGVSKERYLILGASVETGRARDFEHPAKAKHGPLKMGEIAMTVTMRPAYAPEDAQHIQIGELVFNVGRHAFAPRRFTSLES